MCINTSYSAKAHSVVYLNLFSLCLECLEFPLSFCLFVILLLLFCGIFFSECHLRFSFGPAGLRDLQLCWSLPDARGSSHKVWVYRPPIEEVGMDDESCTGWEHMWLGQIWDALLHSAGREWVDKPCTESVRRRKGFGLKDCKSDIFANIKSTLLL